MFTNVTKKIKNVKTLKNVTYANSYFNCTRLGRIA